MNPLNIDKAFPIGLNKLMLNCYCAIVPGSSKSVFKLKIYNSEERHFFLIRVTSSLDPDSYIGKEICLIYLSTFPLSLTNDLKYSSMTHRHAVSQADPLIKEIPWTKMKDCQTSKCKSYISKTHCTLLDKCKSSLRTYILISVYI